MENFNTKSKNKRFENELSDIELREFMRRLDSESTSTSKKTLSGNKRKRRKRKFSTLDIPDILWYAGGIGIILLIMLLEVLILKIPALTVITVAFLEIILSICLNPESFGFHAGAVILNIVLGVVFHMTVFMSMAGVLYVVALVLLYKMQGKIGGY